MFCTTSLAGFRVETMRPRWTLAIGANEIDLARGEIFSGPVAASSFSRWSDGTASCFANSTFFGELSRGIEVDLADREQREVALAVLRRTKCARKRCAGAQMKAADMAGADVDGVRARGNTSRRPRRRSRSRPVSISSTPSP